MSGAWNSGNAPRLAITTSDDTQAIHQCDASGVALRYHGAGNWVAYERVAPELREQHPATHVAFTKPVAAALARVISLAGGLDRAWNNEAGRLRMDEFCAALDALDAARAQETP